MRIGILQAGRLPGDLEASAGPYGRIFRSGLGQSFDYSEIDVTRGGLPAPHSAADAYIITGSAAGVHDSDVWIGEFMRWLRQLDPTIPLVGICLDISSWPRPTAATSRLPSEDGGLGYTNTL